VVTHRGVAPRGVSAGMRAIYCDSIVTLPTSLRLPPSGCHRDNRLTRRLAVRWAPNMVQCAGRWICSMGVLKNTRAWCVRVYSKRPPDNNPCPFTPPIPPPRQPLCPRCAGADGATLCSHQHPYWWWPCQAAPAQQVCPSKQAQQVHS
jgi:hypothetical protein